jgi:hypothetical protein
LILVSKNNAGLSAKRAVGNRYDVQDKIKKVNRPAERNRLKAFFGLYSLLFSSA